ncbi:MAG: pilus assembly protein PilM [Verrucomicrobia bacterium]|nr:pilus assembly protein PilM [Verrucomicrobiota bacterium]
MARRGNSVIGIDLGKRSYKAVLLQKKGEARYVLNSFATHQLPGEPADADAIASELKTLLKDLGGHPRNCAIAVSEPGALLRMIEQPNTPPELLRNALRYNDLGMLNQDCKEFVLDVARISNEPPPSSDGAASVSGEGGIAVQTATATQTRYLVGGMLRAQAKQIVQAAGKARLVPEILQLAPVCTLNAFEFAHPQVHLNEAFLLLDFGHVQSTVLIGRNGELTLTRAFDYGGKHFIDALTAGGALDASAAQLLVQQGDSGMTEICRNTLTRLATEVRNSIGFFEGQYETSIQRLFVSGGLSRIEMVLQTLSDELGLPCEIWDPLENCEVALPAPKRKALQQEFASLSVACGAAFEYLRS